MDSERIDAAALSLLGVALGDAFGQVFLRQSGVASDLLRRREIPDGVWRWTDDTMMAAGIVSVLRASGRIDQDALAMVFAERFLADPERGYGAVAYHILSQIGNGVPWRVSSRSVYGGTGSMGNGAAMRVTPVGAYFSSDMARVVHEASASAEVTHAHPEGQAGAIAVAVAAAFVREKIRHSVPWSSDELFSLLLTLVPKGSVHAGLQAASELQSIDPVLAARRLGNGREITAPDTVPYVIWTFAHHHESFEDALFSSMAGLLDPEADRDTVCAMVGGLAALLVTSNGLPPHWVERLEPLPDTERS